MSWLLRANLFLLFLAAVFDPADLVTHLKVPLFVSVWVLLGFGLLFSKGQSAVISNSLLAYISVFSVILPLTSIMRYYLHGGGGTSYDGFVYLKSFLFVTIAFVVVVKNIDVVPLLSFVLTLLSCAVIGVTVSLYFAPDLRGAAWLLGDVTRTFALSDRNYGDLSYSYVYFHTSPLLALSIAYFTYRVIHSGSRARVFNAALLILNLAAMVCSGTRNNIVFGMLTPLLVLVWYSGKKQKLAVMALVLVGAGIIAAYGSDVVQAMFDSLDESNAIKLAHLHDYAKLFSDQTTLLFGQGLGAYFYSTGFGTGTSITELTYLEFIRNFGLILALVYFGLLLYPLTKLRDAAFQKEHYLLLAYGAYLLICVSNPLLISSNGMLVLAIVLAKVFPAAEREPSLTGPDLSAQAQPA